MSVAAPRFYFEDVVLHGVLETPAMTVTEAHVALYGGVTGDGAREHGLVPDLLPLCLTTGLGWRVPQPPLAVLAFMGDRKSTRLNSSHLVISYAVFCLKKKKKE